MSTVKTLKNISAYQAGESKIAGKNDVIKLSSNESPFGPSQKVLDKIKKYQQLQIGTLKAGVCN